MAREISNIADEKSVRRPVTGGGWEAIDKVRDTELWGVRRTLRTRLVGRCAGGKAVRLQTAA